MTEDEVRDQAGKDARTFKYRQSTCRCRANHPIQQIRVQWNQRPPRRLVSAIRHAQARTDKQNYESRLQGMAVHFPNGNPAEDLCLLSECDYIIGAPSTFSLVAAMYRDIPLCWMLQPRRGGGAMTISRNLILFLGKSSRKGKNL